MCCLSTQHACLSVGRSAGVNRTRLLRDLSSVLGATRLVWFGTRGEDVESVTELPQFAASYSITGAYGRRGSVEALALEDLTGIRVDLDAFELDDELATESVHELRRTLLRFLARPTTLFTYRPSTFISAICFARRDQCNYLGMFKDHQAAFEHKPWVESEVAQLGLPGIKWTYVADEEQLSTLRYLDKGPVILRRSRSSGGTGVSLLDSPDHLRAAWPHQPEEYVSVAPFIEGGLPLNIGGVVWHDGVTIHPASVQLIGVPELTSRMFGYCGNDFGALDILSESELARVESSTMELGRWLRRYGYRGAFGVDFLHKDGQPLFLEINPRFQGSTHLSCQISVENDESCILLEHIAATAGLDAPESRSLCDYRAMDTKLAHFVVHSQSDHRESIDPSQLVEGVMGSPGAARCDVRVHPGLLTDPGGVIARITTRGEVTADGFELLNPWANAISGGGNGQPSEPRGMLTRGQRAGVGYDV